MFPAGQSESWNVVQGNQVEEQEGILPSDVIQAIQEEYWAKFDDLRWMFFRETA